eukprot:g5253.t1
MSQAIPPESAASEPCVSSNGDLESEAVIPVDLPRIERAVREILLAIGEDPDRASLCETPARVARMYAELFSGLHSDPSRHLKKFFIEEYDELVLVRDIAFNSTCEHHLLPFMGVAHVGYLPSGKVAGLSKLARVVEEISRRPQVQERMTHQIADLMNSELDAKGVVVVLEATHTCMTIRGVRKPGSLTVTSGFFRIQMLLTLALSVLAALTIGRLSTVAEAENALIPLAVARGLCIATAVIAFLGSVLWTLERRFGGTVCAVGVLICSTVVLLTTSVSSEQVGTGPGLLTLASEISTSAMVGGCMSAMLLGHWYLTAPTMSIEPLKRLTIYFGIAAVVRFVLSAAGFGLFQDELAQQAHWLWLSLRWLAGVLGPLAVAWMSWRILLYRNTQSATGVLFVGVILTFIGELSATLLFAELGVPF